MAACLLAMLFIGVSMVASLGDYHTLLTIHRPLGILILLLAILRLATRLLTRPRIFRRPCRHRNALWRRPPNGCCIPCSSRCR